MAAISDLILEPTTKAFDPVKEIAFILMQVASGNERMPPLDDALIQMTDKRVSDKDATETLLLRLQAIGSVLVEFMVESDNAEDIVGLHYRQLLSQNREIVTDSIWNASS